MGRGVLPILLIAAAACGQEIIVNDRDTGANTPRDGGVDTMRDGGVDTPRDGGPEAPRDGGPEAPRDGGDELCAGAPYCITDLTPSLTRAPVRTAVTFTPVVDNPGGAPLTFTAPAAEVVATRRASLPDLVMSDVTFDLAVDGNGTATFVLTDVPTWFTTTTFEIVLHASAAGGPTVDARASVTIQGNLLFGTSNSVFAIASDGLPATSVNFTQGGFLQTDTFVRRPNDMILLRNGELLVQDLGTTPQSLKRFSLTGENVLLGTFETDDAGTAFMDSASSYGLTQLDDGRVVVLDSRIGRTPGVRFVIFEENGTYVRSLVPTDPTLRFDGLAPGPNNTFLAGETSKRKILQFDPNTSTPIADFATEVAGISALTRAADGNYYVATGSSVSRISPAGVRSMVNGVQSPTYGWDHLTAFGPTGVAATDPDTDDRDNLIVIDGTASLGYFRVDNTGPFRTPYGMASLE